MPRVELYSRTFVRFCAVIAALSFGWANPAAAGTFTKTFNIALVDAQITHNFFSNDVWFSPTQDPTTPNADRFCGLLQNQINDVFVPVAGQPVYYLVTGVSGGVESSLGQDSGGVERPNGWPCP